LEHDSVDVDGRTLSRPFSVVKVVEVTAQALVEDVGSTKGKSAVTAGSEAGGEFSTSLGWSIELELEVGGNIPSASLGIL